MGHGMGQEVQPFAHPEADVEESAGLGLGDGAGDDLLVAGGGEVLQGAAHVERGARCLRPVAPGSRVERCRATSRPEVVGRRRR